MINIIRETLREELIIKSNPYIFEESYVRNVLNIKKPLNESYYYSENLNKKILQEQLLLEGFWSDLSKLPKKVKNLFNALYKIFTNPETIGRWAKAIEVQLINTPYRKIQNFLKSIIEKCKEFNLPKISEMFTKMLNAVIGLVKKILKISGWKGALIVTCLGLAMKWIWGKVGGFIEKDSASISTFTKEALIEFVKSEHKENIFNIFKSHFGLLSSFDPSGVVQVIDWAKKVFNGVEFLVDNLEPAVRRYEFRGEPRQSPVQLRSSQ